MISVIITTSTEFDPSIKGLVQSFIDKLRIDDTLPGLHIEPLHNVADPRVRTGRVNDGYRAVLFKLSYDDNKAYVFHGVWQHDEAIAIAKRSTLQQNPVNGFPEVRREPLEHPPTAAPTITVSAPPSMLAKRGFTAEVLRSELGLDPDIAERAMHAQTDDEFVELAESAPVAWQGDVIIALGAKESLSDIQAKYGKGLVPADGTDASLAAALRRPEVYGFAWIEDDKDLRAVIEGGSAQAWRVFLHPSQNRVATRLCHGPARVSGGAGTGKTVVVLHRARKIAKDNPSARILLTTFTTNLASALGNGLTTLDSSVTHTDKFGAGGVYVKGIDALASAALKSVGPAIAPAVEAVLGVSHTDLFRRTSRNAWRDAYQTVSPDLPEHLLTATFFADEYDLIVLPNRVTDLDGYLRVRRQGRGTALGRLMRKEVWSVIEAYRTAARVAGTIDFSEAAAIAAAHFERNEPKFDHALVDEGQDLRPVHWQMLRALVARGDNDLFIAEDSHQRIYGPKVTLGRLGIDIVGRSSRLTLNYRTTQQNLQWALGVLNDGVFTDIEGADERHEDFRSARTGPAPILIPCSSPREELDKTNELLTDWFSDESLPREQIAILVRTNARGEDVVRGLAERGLPVRAVDKGAVKPGQPVVMTMHRAKGTEFNRVVLFGVDDSSIPAMQRDAEYDEAAAADTNLRERSLLYAAGSRARDVLAITWSGTQSSLMPR